MTLSPRVRELLPPTVVALYENNYGLALIAFAQFFFACMSLSVKYLMESEFIFDVDLTLATDMSTLTLIFVRMGITGTCCWATLLIQREPYPFLGPPGVRALLAWRGFCGFSGLLCAYQVRDCSKLWLTCRRSVVCQSATLLRSSSSLRV